MWRFVEESFFPATFKSREVEGLVRESFLEVRESSSSNTVDLKSKSFVLEEERSPF